jgi:ubiquinone/menaquinone biosynthesis C-methylase UbiE
MSFQTNTIEQEKHRIKTEYRRRETEIETDLYAPWQPAENFIVSERKMMAATMLHNAGKFPKAGDQCLEIGYGKIGWLADLISWGLRETDLHGIELDEARATQAKTALPTADLRIGDATKLPWEDNSFQFVIASTVFSSILDLEMKRLIAEEIKRVLVKNGVLIWYDLAVNNPKNPNVKGISGKDLRNLFPGFDAKIQSVTLAPPIARLIAPRSLTVANFLSSFPFLRTHLLAVMIKE